MLVTIWDWIGSSVGEKIYGGLQVDLFLGSPGLCLCFTRQEEIFFFFWHSFPLRLYTMNHLDFTLLQKKKKTLYIFVPISHNVFQYVFAVKIKIRQYRGPLEVTEACF